MTRTYISLALIILLGLFIRSYSLSDNPPALCADEIINYVSAKSVVETGRDLHGKLLPYFSDDAVEMRPPIYGYSSYISSMLLGENEAAIRAPAVLFGLLSIIALFLLAYEFFKDPRIALFSAFFLAIVPWHIHFSRIGWGPAALLPFLLFGAYFLVHGINNNKKSLIALAFALFTLSLYTYHAAPLYAFLLLAALFVLNYRYFLREKMLFALCVSISAILTLPYLWLVINEPTMLERAHNINTFKSGVNFQSLIVFVLNYLSHFSPQYLFIYGDPFLRYGTASGIIYWVMMPLILLGIAGLVGSQIPSRYKIFIALWVLIFPLAGALTNDGVPHTPRTLAGAPVFCLLSAFGVGFVYNSLQSRAGRPISGKTFLIIVLLLSFLSLGYFSKHYFWDYPKRSYRFWDYGHKELFTKIKQVQHKYERACIEDLNKWNRLPMLSYYLPETNLEIIAGISDPRCKMSGSIVVQRTGKGMITSDAELIESIKAPNDRYIYFINVIE